MLAEKGDASVNKITTPWRPKLFRAFLEAKCDTRTRR
jgi:hypothetical protein